MRGQASRLPRVNQSRGDLVQATDLHISYNWEMEWGQVAIFFAVACFAAIVLFMVYRKPQA